MEKPSLLFVKELTESGSEVLSFDDVLKREMVDQGFFSGNRFSFVGLYYSVQTQTTVIGYPKYLPDVNKNNRTAIIHHVQLICKVAAQAESRLKLSRKSSAYNFDSYAAQPENQRVTPYNLATFIVQDYIEYGLFSEKTKTFEVNGGGNINWSRTMHSFSPIIDRVPVFLQVVTQRFRRNGAHIITPLHAWIVTQCAKLLQTLGEYTDLELPALREDFEDNDLEQYVPYLLGKLSYVFSERELRLLRALAAWCGQSVFYRYCFGVTAFELLWEYAAKQVFGNIDDTRSGPPSYHINGKVYKGSGASIPDILRVFSDNDNPKNNYFGILDAKYYLTVINEGSNTINYAPPNSDIAKQIEYCHYLRQLYPSDSILFSNSFLLPAYQEKVDGLYRGIGYAVNSNERNDMIEEALNVVSPKSDSRHDRVLIFKVNPQLLFEACLKGETIDNNSFIRDFITPFQH